MAETLKPVALLLLILNLCMYVILAIIGGWAVNISIDRGFILGPGLRLPAHFHPIFFPIGNWATGFFVVFSLFAGVVGIASGLVGFSHIRHWNYYSLQPAATTGLLAWALTGTMEAFTIVLTATQLFYILAIHSGSRGPVPVERPHAVAAGY
uniref:Uncharacterized protein n=1 Tax=Oryza nivara TaxID=4536 RepID=A0A0E0FJF0_ORYNI